MLNLLLTEKRVEHVVQAAEQVREFVLLGT